MKKSFLAAIAVFFGTAYAAEPGYVLISADADNRARQVHSISLCTRSGQCPDQLKFPAEGGLFQAEPGVYKISKVVIGDAKGRYRKTIDLNSERAIEVRPGAVTLVGNIGVDLASRKVNRTVPVALQDSACDQHGQLMGSTPLFDAFNADAGPYQVMCRPQLQAPPRRPAGHTLTASARGERL